MLNGEKYEIVIEEKDSINDVNVILSTPEHVQSSITMKLPSVLLLSGLGFKMYFFNINLPFYNINIGTRIGMILYTK